MPGGDGVVLLHLEPAELGGDGVGSVGASRCWTTEVGAGGVVHRAADEAEPGETLPDLAGEPARARAVAHVHDIVAGLDVQRRRGLQRRRRGCLGGLAGPLRGLLLLGAAPLDERAHLPRVDPHHAAPGVGLDALRRHGVEGDVPAAMPDPCRANASRSQPWSRTTDWCATVISPRSFAGSVRVPPLRILAATAARNTCWRRMRERSPSGRPWRWRTNASAVRAGDGARSGGEPRTGQHVIDRGLEAHVDPADRAGQVVEAEQVHLGEVVHRDPGQLLHRPDQGDRPACVASASIRSRSPHALTDEPLGRQRLHAGYAALILSVR